MSTITREQQKQILIDTANHVINRDNTSPHSENMRELARIALASLEAEPVAYMVGTQRLENMTQAIAYKADTALQIKPLYTAPPAPVSVPKVPNSVTAETCNLDEPGHDWNEAEYYAQGWNACRAAMLQGADGNSPLIPDGLRLALSNAGIAAPESDEMLAATCEKYIQALVDWVKDRKPFEPAKVVPDGWVACSERMPEKADEVLCAKEFDGPGDWRQKVGYYLAGKWTVYSASWTPTHWMPLPAAPQQEVTLDLNYI